MAAASINVQALRDSSPLGHISSLWAGLVLLRAMITFNSTAVFAEIVVAMYAHEAAHPSASGGGGGDDATAHNHHAVRGGRRGSELTSHKGKQEQQEQESECILKLVELLKEMGVRTGHIEALVLRRSEEIFDSVASLDDPGLREARGLLDLLQHGHGEGQRTCQVVRALHDLCGMVRDVGGVHLVPVQMRVMLASSSSSSSRAAELVQKIFAACPQALYTIDGDNAAYSSSNEELRLDAHARLALIKSRPRPG